MATTVREEPPDELPDGFSDAVVVQSQRLGGRDVAAVLDLVRRASDSDGVAPLSEHVLLHLRSGGQEPGRHLIVRGTSGGEPTGAALGYAHLDPTDQVDGASAELVVHPDHRRRGHGRRLVEALVGMAAECADGRLRLWAHGESTDAAALAQAMGFDRVRELWQLRRSLYAALPRVEVPDDVVVRTFRPGDEDSVLAVNAAAFADHPEQGRWTRADLDARMAEDWFDPGGLFLAERARGGHEGGGELLAFHWTKVHGAGGEAPEHTHADGSTHAEGTGHGHEPIGEVYVVGVSPAAQGRGLGRLMTVVGLRHLRDRGLTQAMLYVDADNTAAVRTYTGMGFSRWDVDVQFGRRV